MRHRRLEELRVTEVCLIENGGGVLGLEEAACAITILGSNR